LIELFDTILLNPMVNGLVALSGIFGGSFGMAIVFLTLLINVLILPLTLRQVRSTKKMQALQPKMKELQKKYAKDKQKLQSETIKLYRESGVNPVGCFVPLLVQMPILIALYRAIIQALATTPENLFGLSDNLYSVSIVQQSVPPESQFLWIDLAKPNFPLVLLIMATMWLSQKMSATPSTDPKQQQTQTMMQWMMPLFMGFIFIGFPSGLALYIVVGTIFRMGVQRFVMGNWGGLATLVPGRAPSGPNGEIEKVKTPSAGEPRKEIRPAAKKAKVTTTKQEGIGDEGTSRSKRKKRRRSR